MPENQHIDRWRSLATQLYLILAAVEGLLALILFLRLPADPIRLGWGDIRRSVWAVLWFCLPGLPRSDS